ncbi:hypothetical protein ACTFWW_27865, partial [Klebsiella pneumoniae]
FLRTAVNDFMDSVHHIWCPLSSQEFQDLPDGAETTLTGNRITDFFKSITEIISLIECSKHVLSSVE